MDNTVQYMNSSRALSSLLKEIAKLILLSLKDKDLGLENALFTVAESKWLKPAMITYLILEYNNHDCVKPRVLRLKSHT